MSAADRGFGIAQEQRWLSLPGGVDDFPRGFFNERRPVGIEAGRQVLRHLGLCPWDDQIHASAVEELRRAMIQPTDLDLRMDIAGAAISVNFAEQERDPAAS